MGMSVSSIRIGVLYPGADADDDYALLAQRLGPPRVDFDVVHTEFAEDAHRRDALLEIGSDRRLLEGAAGLASRPIQAVAWACTSGSFVYGLDGARRQARLLEDALGVRATTTPLAFLAALRNLGVTRVALAATYPTDVSAIFVEFLAKAGIEVVRVTCAGIYTGGEVGRLDPGAVRDLVRQANDPDARAVLVPDTALHTVARLDELDAAAGKAVLTANQVTAWETLRLSGREQPERELGILFRKVPLSIADDVRVGI
jgi:maleate cis-trans isomerase